MKTLILMVGLPRSGKSTLARQLGVPMVNPDSIRLAIHGKSFEARAEGYVWATAKAMVGALFIAGHDTVVLDATNVTVARRKAWKSENWSRRFIVVNTPESECKARAAGNEEMIGVITRMAAAWQPITPEELGPDDVLEPIDNLRQDSHSA